MNKIVLAYSGGLDTSCIIPWLKEKYKGVKVVAFCALLGESESHDILKERAKILEINITSLPLYIYI